MDSLSLENLYFNKDFDDYLFTLARKNFLPFDDFKQEAFLLILNANKRSISECKRIAVNLAMRTKYHSIREDNHYDVSDDYLTRGAMRIA